MLANKSKLYLPIPIPIQVKFAPADSNKARMLSNVIVSFFTEYSPLIGYYADSLLQHAIFASLFFILDLLAGLIPILIDND